MTTLNATIDPFVGTVTTTNMASCTCPQWPRISRKCLHENTKYGVKTFKVEQIALQYWYNTIAFSGLSGSMEEDFSTESQLWKKVSQTRNQTPYMRKGKHSPFKLESSDKDHHNHHHLIIIDMVLALASLQRNSLSRYAYCKRRRDFGFFRSVNHFSESRANANHIVRNVLAENDFASKLLKNS